MVVVGGGWKAAVLAGGRFCNKLMRGSGVRGIKVSRTCELNSVRSELGIEIGLAESSRGRHVVVVVRDKRAGAQDGVDQRSKDTERQEQATQ